MSTCLPRRMRCASLLQRYGTLPAVRAPASRSLVVWWDGTVFDVDYNSWQEGKNGSAGDPTYAIITSRSFHPGIVQAAFADGSVQVISEDIQLANWRAMATRNQGESISVFD